MLLRSFLAWLFLGVVAHCGHPVKAIPATARQLVVVTTETWESSRANVYRYTRTSAAAPWTPVGKPATALVGERGMAWGLGMQPIPLDASRQKREGDRCAPAGVFRITGAFGTSDAVERRGFHLPYRILGSGTEAVDDPASRYYNRVVERGAVAKPDWRRAERMVETPAYRLGLTIDHNPRNIPDAGSCIFFHLWTGRRTGTAGCTILHRADLLALAQWLDPALSPTLVQMPREEVRSLNLPH